MPIIQWEFSRRPPNQEDEYFYELEHRRQEIAERSAPGAEAGPEPVIRSREAEPPAGFWRRVYRALTGHFDMGWSP